MSEHPGSRDTYDTIAQWIAPDFFFSKRDLWDRFGMLGVFGDFVLSCTKGSILEIGVGESSIYLTGISRKYNRRIWHCDVSTSKILNPMTIPGYLSPDLTYMEERDEVPNTLERCVLYAGTSDSFFRRLPIDDLALAFIDGDHVYEQAKRDFDNVWPLIVENGYVLLHDTHPPSAEWTSENACGEVYRLRQELQKRDDLDILTLPRGCAIGVGLTIVRKREKGYPYL